MNFQIRHNTVTEEELKDYLQKNFYQFHDSFSEMCLKTNYSHKLFVNALTFEIWDDSLLAGLVCAYLNYESKIVYIPYVCISKDYSGMGLASTLFDFLEEYCRERLFEKISLEVRGDNYSAISLYYKKGFSNLGKVNGKNRMEKIIMT